MPETSSQPVFESFGGRAFSFYPAIRNVEYNEWTFLRETWSEILVANSRSGAEIWIPRQYVDRISSADEPVLIVGLKRELELAGGAVWPFDRQVLEMPAPPRPGTRTSAPPAVAPPARAPAGPSTESQMGRLIGYALVMGLGLCLMVVVFAFEGLPRPQDWLRKRNIATADQQYLSLTREDSRHDVVRKLGAAESGQWITAESAEIQFHLLWYPRRSYAVVLMGADRAGARYIGTIHASSRVPLDSVPLAGGGSTASMLRTLPKF